MAVCKRCNKKALVTDSVTGNTVCASCGVVQDFDNYQEQFGDGGNYITHGTTGSDHDYSYKERKIYHANSVIEDITFRLHFADERTREVKELVKKVTEGELGLGNWFDVLVGACCYILMRQKMRVLTINEVCDVSGCELYEMGRMIGRVVEYLGLELPEFDIVGLLERTIRGFSGFEKVDPDKVEVMVKQGNFVVQCCIKWWLTTGRRPGHVAVAVLVFVAGVNGINVRIQDVAKEVNVGLATCRLRYKELLKALVEVAKALPWGNDINLSNILRNAPSVINYMEMKSMEDHTNNSNNNNKATTFIKTGFKKTASKDGLEPFCDRNIQIESISVGVENEPEGGGGDSSVGDLELLKTSHDALADLYSKFKADFARRKLVNKDEVDYYEYEQDEFFDEWWSGKSEMCEKLFLKQLEDKDVGLNTLPPSYIRGCLAVKRRREKIRAAKTRINIIRFPPVDEPACSRIESIDEQCLPEKVIGHKKRKRRNTKTEKLQDTIDWEDFIIETLLLCKVKEEEIEKGHYKALLGLYVFTGSG